MGLREERDYEGRRPNSRRTHPGHFTLRRSFSALTAGAFLPAIYQRQTTLCVRVYEEDLWGLWIKLWKFKECSPFQIYQSALSLPRQPAAVFPPFKSAKRWLVDLKRPAFLEFLWSLSFAPIILRKLYLWLQHRFSRKLLEGWSSNSTKR